MNSNIKSLVDKLLEKSLAKPRKFSESVEVIVNLEMDEKADALRGHCELPNETGKNKRIAVFSDDSVKKQALLDAGADAVGVVDLLADIMVKKIDYDVYLASAPMMKQLSKAAPILGPRNLMPNNKLGTLTDNPESIIAKMKNKIVFFKSVKGMVQARIADISLGSIKIEENIRSFIKHVVELNKVNKLAPGKKPIKSIYIKSTMGNVIPIDIKEFF